MNASQYIRKRQELWALRRGIKLQASEGASAAGDKLYAPTLEANLFEPLSAKARRQFEAGDGHELRGPMKAVHSSSAAACNLFHYWARRKDLRPIARACKVPSPAADSLEFEAHHEIDAQFERTPNLDAEIKYGRGSIGATAFECKLSEPFQNRQHARLSPKYLKLKEHWEAYPKLQKLATGLAEATITFQHFDASQVVKHILGLNRSYEPGNFRLVYVFYDVAGVDGARHLEEIDRFAEVATQDGIRFQSRSYQAVIASLGDDQRQKHRKYVDYLAERYL